MMHFCVHERVGIAPTIDHHVVRGPAPASLPQADLLFRDNESHCPNAYARSYIRSGRFMVVGRTLCALRL